MNDYIWLTDLSRQFLEKDYLLPGESVEERIWQVCLTAENILGIKGFADDFNENMKKGWYSWSSPVWANFGRKRGLPISCFGSYVEDTMDSILYTQAEVGMMTKYGGGTSAYFGKLRGRGSKISDNGESSGPVHFMQLFDTSMTVISQGAVRRGNFAAYLDIDHPDILEFLSIKSEGHPIQHISFGVCISDKWMEEMISGDISKRKVWAKVLESRSNVGYPYILFTDNANKNTVDVYKEKSLRISHSNLCSEIMLPDGPDESFVCDLSSMNILHFDEWKDTNAVELLVYFLDAVMTEFISKANNIQFLQKPVRFALRHRALGLGQLGWHRYLQSKMIPFESMEAKTLNIKIAKTIHDQAYVASAKLAKLFGEPELLKGYGRRNTTLIAIAPTKSSAWILGQNSEAIEPDQANIFIKDLAKGKFTFKNPYLTKLLQQKNKDNENTWKSILEHGGSVQHLDFFSQNEKDVFKTFSEISQKEIIIQASQRQRYIDQGQSLNMMIHPSIPIKDVNKLYIEAWELGIKALYYQKGVNAAQEFSRNILQCKSCEG